MTDKNLADECARLERWCVTPYAYGGHWPLPNAAATDIKALITALRASAAPQEDFSKQAQAILYLWSTGEGKCDPHRTALQHRIEDALRSAYAAGQTARAKRDVEVAKNFQADCCLDCGLALTSPIIVAQAIEKDAAG